MKQHSYFRKLLAFIISSLVLTISISKPVHATDNGSIVLTNAIPSETYSLYRIFDVTYQNYGESSVHEAAFYTSSGDSDPFLTALQSESSPFALTRILDSDQYNVTKKESRTSDDAITFLYQNITHLSALTGLTTDGLDSESKATGTTVKWKNLSPGYYFIASSVGHFVMAGTPENNTVTLQEKNNLPALTLEQSTKPDAGFTSETIDAYINYPVYYRLKVDFKTSNHLETTVKSTLKNLTYNNDIVFYLNTISDENILDTNTYTHSVVNNVITITFNADFVSNLTDSDYVWICYSANLNKTAATGSATSNNRNSTTLQYSQQTISSDVKVHTYRFDIAKTDKNNVLLSGGEFRIYDEHGNVLKFEYVENVDSYYINPDGNEKITGGLLKLLGLMKGKYYIEETKAPDGYQILTNRKEFTVNDDSKVVKDNQIYQSGGLQVVNTPGTSMFQTGSFEYNVLMLTAVGFLVAGVVLLMVKGKHV